MRCWRGTRPYLRWASVALAPLVVGRSSATATLAAAAGVAVLVLVLVVAVIALGAAFGRNVERRPACLQTLQTLLRLARGRAGGDRPPIDNGFKVTVIEATFASLLLGSPPDVTIWQRTGCSGVGRYVARRARCRWLPGCPATSQGAGRSSG